MKIGQLVRLALALAVVVAAIGATAPARAQTPLLYVDPDSIDVSNGTVFTLDVAVSGDVTSLMGWDITVTFNNSVIEFLGASEGTLPLSSGPSFFWTEPGLPAGTVHVNGAILGHTVDGPGTLFELEFLGHSPVGIHTSDVTITASVMRTGVNEDIIHDTENGIVRVVGPIATEAVTWGLVKSRYAAGAAR